MKYFIFVLLFFITMIITAGEVENTVMLFIHGKNIKLTDVQLMNIRGGVEEIVTKNGFLLVEEETQNEVLKEQATQRKKQCYDDTCVVDVGKMLAAKKLLKTEVMKGNNSYIFNGGFTDLEKGVKERTKKEIFKGNLNDEEALSKFINMLSKKLIEGDKENIETNTNNTDNEIFYELKINSNISEAKVYIDDEMKGKTPFSTKIKKGSYKVKVSQSEYEDKEELIPVNDNKTITFQLYKKEKKKEEVKNTISKNGEMVKIPGKKFKMDKTEVTVAQFKECVNAGKCSKKNFKTNTENSNNNYSTTGKENHPMNAVNWYGADEYCKWAGKRLPTEEEWEYAAKGGENYKYSGSENAGEVAWYYENSKMKTQEVATKKANGYSLYDLSGNVWEWTNSWLNNKEIYRILRGGCVGNDEYEIRVDSRVDGIRDFIDDNRGFRCVQDEK